jgi:hypothetical protein
MIISTKIFYQLKSICWHPVFCHTQFAPDIKFCGAIGTYKCGRHLHQDVTVHVRPSAEPPNLRSNTHLRGTDQTHFIINYDY